MRVVALEHAVAAPLCTRHLADLGAEVIKIERPGEGDFARGYDRFVRGISSFVVWLNRGKRSVTLDLKHQAARAVLDRLIERADALVQNLAPGAAARLGLSYEALSPRHPRLVVCDISGYGASGPYAQKKAYDLLIQAESGLISVTGTPEQPSRVGVSAADIATGMYAQSAVLAALLRRERSGQGAHVSVAMLDALAEWMTYPMYRTAYADSPLPREALSHPALAPYGAHRAKDGQVIFGLQNEREWATFCAKVMGRPDWVSDPRYRDNSARREHREELKGEIEAFFADKTAREVVALLDAAGIANGRLNDARDLWEHEQLAARDRWREIDSPAGRLRALLPPVTFADAEAAMGAVPALGQHTDAVLAELGYAPGDITALREAGAV
ncbi:MAG: CoA transferase [Acetobacteraceae bacterium]|nr:CoA transferase [Acetobacteraceae bacterium]